MFRSLKQRLIHFLRNEDGPTTVEYAVMLAVIIIMSIGAVMNTGEVQQTLWTKSGDALSKSWDEATDGN